MRNPLPRAWPFKFAASLLLLVATAGAHFDDPAAQGSRQDAVLIDEYGNIRFGDEEARLDNFAVELQNYPDSEGHIVYFQSWTGAIGAAKARAERARDYLIYSRGVDELRLRIVQGRYREEFAIQLWRTRAGGAVPLGADGPGEPDASQSLPTLDIRTLNAGRVMSLAFSPDGKVLAVARGDSRDASENTVELWSVSTGREFRTLEGRGVSVENVAFSRDGKLLAGGGRDGVVRLWDVSSGASVGVIRAGANGVSSVAFSPRVRMLASADGTRMIKLWDVPSGRQIGRLTGEANESISQVVFSPDGQTLASASGIVTDGVVGNGKVKIWKLGARLPSRVMEHDFSVASVAYSSDGKLLSSVLGDTIKVWDLSRDVQPLVIGDGVEFLSARSVAFGPGDKYLVGSAGGMDTESILFAWDVDTGRQLAKVHGDVYRINAVAFSDDGKVLASGGADRVTKLWEVLPASDGLEIKQLLGLIPVGTKDWLAFTPDGLFDGTPSAWRQTFWRFTQGGALPVEAFFGEFFHPDLLADVLGGKRPRATQSVAEKDRRQPRVEIALADSQASGQPVPAGEVAVFVKVSSAPVADGALTGGARDVRLFRDGMLVKYWPGAMLQGAGSATLTAVVSLLPGPNRLTAYAFNDDNIKSSDAEIVVPGPEQPRRPSSMYILAVGVNRYSARGLDLRYAVPDARAFGAEVKRQQDRLGEYAETVVVPLTDEQATKHNILHAIRRLGERAPTPLRAGAPGQLEKLKFAGPADAIIVYFAGHGLAVGQRFYLIPHDVSCGGRRKEDVDGAEFDQLTQCGISDLELETAFRDVPAGRILLVIDACNSGQALEADERRRGPMNSKGLAQLAYEKGMYILTAAQSYQAARETRRLGHGVLTYVLVHEGLRGTLPDREPRDGQVSLREWLDFAAERVPRVELARVARDRKVRRHSRPAERREALGVQRPRVFYRREPEERLLIVARPGASSNRRARGPERR